VGNEPFRVSRMDDAACYDGGIFGGVCTLLIRLLYELRGEKFGTESNTQNFE